MCDAQWRRGRPQWSREMVRPPRRSVAYPCCGSRASQQTRCTSSALISGSGLGLQVHALSEHIGGDNDVVAIIVAASRRVGGARGEPPDDPLFALGACRARQEGDAAAVRGEALVATSGLLEVLVVPVHGVGVIAEDQYLAPVAGVCLPDALSGGMAAIAASSSTSTARFGSSPWPTLRAVAAKSRSKFRSRSTCRRSGSVL